MKYASDSTFVAIVNGLGSSAIATPHGMSFNPGPFSPLWASQELFKNLLAIHLCGDSGWKISFSLILTGSINLSSCLSVVTLNENIKNYKFVFDVCTSERVYHLAADTEKERLDWVSTLKDLLFSPQVSTSAKSSACLNQPKHTIHLTR